jgi:regulator of replication initiation timing
MKPKETNTAPITPTAAHRSLVADIVNYDHEAGALLPWDDCAQLIADSEARALSSLAMVTAESADRNVSLRLENDQLRAENKANQHELAEARNAERLARMQLDLARAERDAERARLDYLSTRGFEHRHLETGDHLAYEWTISSTNELKDVSLREVIDAAMKEGA